VADVPMTLIARKNEVFLQAASPRTLASVL
jgi:hypothetical protein